MDEDLCEVEIPQEMTFSEMMMEAPISITIPSREDEAPSSANCSEATYEDDDRASSSDGSVLSIPLSVGSSTMITTRSVGSRSSFDGFPSTSSSVSMTNDRELVSQACLSLRQAPEEIQALDLSTNTSKPRRPLKSLRALSELVNLVQLDLAGNAVERLDGLQVFTQLQTLAMPRNHLKTVSAPLFVLKGLTHLDLSGNFIVHLPRAFSGLTMLEVLNLSGNNLGTLREVDVLAPLANLTSCSLAANPFCRLPTYKDYVICKVRSLERLDDVEISRVARDRAAKRFGSAMFSQDACLREAGRVHEDEQNRLHEAKSALEAENLRLKGELQVKSKLLQNKSRAWSSATEQLLQLQQEVAMLNLDRRRSVTLPNEELSEAEQIAMAIAERHRATNSTQQRPQSAPRIPSPVRIPSPIRSVEKRCGSFSNRDIQFGQCRDGESDEERATDSKDAACMPMSPSAKSVLKRSKSKMFVASCSPLRTIPPAIVTKLPNKIVDGGEVEDEDEKYVLVSQESDDISSPTHAWEQEEMASFTRRPASPAATANSQQQQERARSHDKVRRALYELDPQADRPALPTSTALNVSPEDDETLEPDVSRAARAASATTQEQRERTRTLDPGRRALYELDSPADSIPRATLPTSPSLTVNLEDDESFEMHELNSSRSARFPSFEDDTACPAYEDMHNPALQSRSSSASALGNRNRSSSYCIDPAIPSSGSHSLPPSPKNSPTRLREWYRKQKELRLMTPPPSPPRRREDSPQYKVRRPELEASPLAPFVDKEVLARQIQALQSCKQSLLTEIRNEEHLLHVLKQESERYTDQIDCLSVNIQACLDGDPSSIRFSFSPPGSPRGRSKKLHEEETGRARLEILRNKLRFAEDKEKEIENTMVRMTKRVLQADLIPVNGESSIREKFSPVGSSQAFNVPFDKEIFALTHKLQLVIVEKEEIHMQMSQLMAQLRGESIANGNVLNFGGDADDESVDGGVNNKQVLSLAKSRQTVDELRTRHREVTERILLKERRISSLLEELKEVEAEVKHISSLNVSSAFSPLFQREHIASLDFLQAVRSSTGENANAFWVDDVNTAILTIDTTGSRAESPSQFSSLTSDQIAPPAQGSIDQLSRGRLSLQSKELLNSDMLEEIKADIYEKMSQQLAMSAGKSGNECSSDGGRTELHQAIAAALETRLHLVLNTTKDTDDHERFQQDATQQNNCQENETLTNTEVPEDATATDEVCCEDFDEFAPVEAHYAKKFVLAKDRVSTFVKSISDEEGNTTAMPATHVTSAQRILKICERLEVAEAKSKFDPISKIEVDQQGNSRGSLKIVLQAARDLPTAHLRTKNLDPYVSFEVVYPSHAVPLSANCDSTTGRRFRSQTKKKSIYPVWDEDFEIAPILSLNGYLHVRVLNDRRLSHEQLVGETRIPLQTLLHQKRIVEWFSLGLTVTPVSTGSRPSRVVSKLCGGAIRLQLQFYFSSVERYKHVIDELVTRYLHDHSQLPLFIDSVDGGDQVFSTEQPEQDGTDPVFTTTQRDISKVYDQLHQSDVEAHFPLDELATSLPPYKVVKTDKQETSQLNSNFTSSLEHRIEGDNRICQGSSTQLSSERRKSLWETKTSDRLSTDDKKPYFGFSASTAERKKQSLASFSMMGPTRSRTPIAQSKTIRSASALQPHTSLRRRGSECFDKYSPYHPGFKSADLIDGCNNELGGTKSGRTVSHRPDMNRSVDLSIFKRPSSSRRPPSSGFPERYIGLDNQACERLKRIFGRMDGTAT